MEKHFFVAKYFEDIYEIDPWKVPIYEACYYVEEIEAALVELEGRIDTELENVFDGVEWDRLNNLYTKFVDAACRLDDDDLRRSYFKAAAKDVAENPLPRRYVSMEEAYVNAANKDIEQAKEKIFTKDFVVSILIGVIAGAALVILFSALYGFIGALGFYFAGEVGEIAFKLVFALAYVALIIKEDS